MNIPGKYLPSVYWLLLLGLSYFAFFHHLQRLPVNLWDESWYALNAQEMLENGKWFEVYILGQPDFGNSKPPLALWCMIPFIKLYGFNELGIRMASACFALFTTFLLHYSASNVFKNKRTALIVPFILISSTGYVSQHIARTGDTDSILSFWILAQCICFYKFVSSEQPKIKAKYIILTALCVSLACLTKGIAGLLAVPAFIGWLVAAKQVKQVFLNKYVYIALAIFLVLVPGYYLLREQLTPGYLNAVWHAEIGGRLHQQEFLNQNALPFYYYYQAMITDKRLLTWIFVLPVSIVYIVKAKPGNVRTFGLFFITALLSVSLLLALSSTKLPWYDAPLYPLIAVVIGTSIAMFLDNKPVTWFVATCAILFTPPYLEIILANTKTQYYTSYPYFLKQLRNTGHKSDRIYIINADPNFMIHFYAKQDALNGHDNKVVTHDDEELTIGKHILTEKYERRVDVNNKFVLEPIADNGQCSYYKIIGIR